MEEWLWPRLVLQLRAIGGSVVPWGLSAKSVPSAVNRFQGKNYDQHVGRSRRSRSLQQSRRRVILPAGDGEGPRIAPFAPWASRKASATPITRMKNLHSCHSRSRATRRLRRHGGNSRANSFSCPFVPRPRRWSRPQAPKDTRLRGSGRRGSQDRPGARACAPLRTRVGCFNWRLDVGCWVLDVLRSSSFPCFLVPFSPY
jgi:hypothetical protein